MTYRESKYPRIRARRDAILAVLREHPVAPTTKEVVKLLGGKHPYATVYADLRLMCGSNQLSYAEHAEHPDGINVPGYPVVWHGWWQDGGGDCTVWTLTPEWRTQLDDLAAEIDLETLWELPTHEPEGRA